MAQRLARMEQAMAALEQKVADQEALIRQQQTTLARYAASNAEAGAPPADNTAQSIVAAPEAWHDRLEVDGSLDIQASYHRPFSGDDESDLLLSTFELGVAAQLSEWVNIRGSLLYEQEATPLEVDVAMMTLGNGASTPFFLAGGQFYVPFGVYETHMISDPLTLDLGETRETALQAGFALRGWQASLYAFSGAVQKDGQQRIGNWGANLGYGRDSAARSWGMQVGYLNDLGEADQLQDVIAEHLGGNPRSGRIAGWTARATAQFDHFQLIGEYLTADQAFAHADLPWGASGAQPQAWNLEIGYAFDLFGKDANVALGYQGSAEALALELPETRWIAALSLDLQERTSLAFEWAHDQDYARDVGGSGQQADTLSAQLGLEF